MMVTGLQKGRGLFSRMRKKDGNWGSQRTLGKLKPVLISDILSSVPPEWERLKSGGLQVFSLDGSWLDRLVILTSRAIFVISIDDCLDEDGNHPERVMDVIPLEGIEFIGLSNNHEDAAVPEAFATGKFAAASTPTHRHLRGSNSKGHASNDGSKKGVMSGNGSWESAKLSAWKSLKGLMSFFGVASEGEDEPRRRRARAGSVLGIDAEEEAGRGSSAGDGITFEIRTEHDSYNLGKTYRIRAGTNQECLEWMTVIDDHVSSLLYEQYLKTSFLQGQMQVSSIYNSLGAQSIIALLIIANFVCNCVEAELNPGVGTDLERAFSQADIAFGIVFAVDLAVNLFAHWFLNFFRDNWNCFDFVVVIVSLVCTFATDTSEVTTIRMLRAFRVIRLFGKLKSLRTIINALAFSMLPVLNAFFIFVLVTAVYSIVGQSIFSNKFPNYFGTFTLSLFTMFQVSTGDSWASDVARPMMFGRVNIEDQLEIEEGGNSTGQIVLIALFFCSFVFIVTFTLLQVVVAVLLDNFVNATDLEKQRQASQNMPRVQKSSLDPLLTALLQYNTDVELSGRVSELFDVLDENHNGRLSFKECSEGFRRLDLGAPIFLAHSDWEHSCVAVGCHSDEGMNKAEFEAMIRTDLDLYVQRHLEAAVANTAEDDVNSTMIFALKRCLLGIGEIRRDLYPATSGGDNTNSYDDAACVLRQNSKRSVISAESSQCAGSPMGALDVHSRSSGDVYTANTKKHYSIWTHRSKDPASASNKDKSNKTKADKILAGEAEINWNTASAENSRDHSLEHYSGRDLTAGTPFASHPTSPSGADLSGKHPGMRQLGRAASFNPRGGGSTTPRLVGSSKNSMPRSGSVSSALSNANVHWGDPENLQSGGGMRKVASISSMEEESATVIMAQRATRAMVQEEVAKATQQLLEEMDRRNKNLEGLIGAAISRLGEGRAQPVSGGVDAAVVHPTLATDQSREPGMGRALSPQAIGEALEQANLQPVDVNSSTTVRQRGGGWDGRPYDGGLDGAGPSGSFGSSAQLRDVEALISHGSDLEQLSMVAESPAALSPHSFVSQTFTRGSLPESLDGKDEQCA